MRAVTHISNCIQRTTASRPEHILEVEKSTVAEGTRVPEMLGQHTGNEEGHQRLGCGTQSAQLLSTVTTNWGEGERPIVPTGAGNFFGSIGILKCESLTDCRNGSAASVRSPIVGWSFQRSASRVIPRSRWPEQKVT